MLGGILPGMLRDEPLLPVLTSRAEARQAGLTDRQLTRRLRNGDWRAVRRGLLVPGAALDRVDPDQLEIVAAVRSTGRDVAVAVAHAARIWGLARPVRGWGKPMLLASSGPTRNQGDLCIRVAPIVDGDLLELPDGLVVTSPCRTVADCARMLWAPDALAVADSALRQRLLSRSELATRLDLMKGWPGIVQARRVLGLADPRRETALESWSALAFDDAGVPMPQFQLDVHDLAGFVGRVDFLWSCGLVGESDGRTKYRLAAAQRRGEPAERLAAVLDEERERERRLRATGAGVVRWGPRDVLTPSRADALATHIRRELADQMNRQVQATARPAPLRLTPSTGLLLLKASNRYIA